jgi:cytoskeletal protein RodZ
MARGTFGERLKRERELREVPPEEITLATRIGPRFLEALENEDWDKLPGGVFNRGFVRSIARYLGLDEEAFLAEYDLAYNAHAQLLEQKHAAQKIENRIPPTPLWMPIAFVVGALLILAGLIYGSIYAWHRFVKHRAASPASSAVSPGSSTSSAPPTNPPQFPALELAVSASAESQVTIQADGTTVFDSALHPGENRHFTANSVFVVTTGDSSAVLLELNGEAMPPAGAPGRSGTITLTRSNLRQASGGNSQP